MQLVLASNNEKKVAELKKLFANTHFKVTPQSAFNTVEAIENGKSFIENAIIKARNACFYSKQASLADDSGICVPYLQGQPGIHSARFAGEHGNDKKNNEKLLSLMSNCSGDERRAYFFCALASLAYPDDPTPVTAIGIWWGSILREPLGENGFGYDPIFYVPEYQCSSAQLEPHIKNTISHRAQALHAMHQHLLLRYPNTQP